MLPVRIESKALPLGICGVRLNGGFVEVETQSISDLSGKSGSMLVGIVDAVEGFVEDGENSEARLRIALCSSTRDRCVVTLFGDLAWACRSMGVAVTMVVCGAQYASSSGKYVVGPRVAGCVSDDVLARVEAAHLRSNHPLWSLEDAERVVRNRIAAFRKQKQRAGSWPEAPVAALHMRADRCWLCGDAWASSSTTKCASWPVCGARRSSNPEHSSAAAAEAAISLELASSTSFIVRRLPAPRGEPTDLSVHDETQIVHRPLAELDSIVKDLTKKAESGQIRGLRLPPPATLRTILEWRQRPLQQNVEEVLKQIPPRLFSRLLPFQVQGVKFCLERKRALIADEMGLGKTLQAIAVAAAVRDEAWPLMVVCPAGVRSMWANEIENWLEIAPTDLVVIKGQSDAPPPPPAPPPRIVVVSFNMLERLPELSREAFSFGTVIVDEAQNLQTSTSQLFVRSNSHFYESAQTRVTCSVAAKAKIVVMLSGTPALVRPVSTFALFESLATGCSIRRHWLGSRDTNDRRLEFARHWAGARRNRVKHRRNNRVKYDAIAFPAELNAVLTNLFMIRRLKKDVLSQLPPLSRRVVRLDNDGYDDDDALSMVRKARKSDADDFQLCGLSKVARAARWIVERVATRKQKLVVFAHHVAVIDCLHAAIEAARRDEDLAHDEEDEGENDFVSSSVWYGRTERIDGSTCSSSRERITRDFRRLDEFKILLVSITAGGVGIDLSRATEAVFVESVGLAASWLRQAEDRLHRRGQRSAVSAFYLLGPRGSWDNALWPTLDAQLGANTSVFNGAQDAELFAVRGETPPKDGPSQQSPVAGGESSPDDHSPASETSRDEEEIASWKWCCDDTSKTLPPSESRVAFAVSRHTGRLHVYLDSRYTGQSFETEQLLVVVETGRRSNASAAREAARRRLPKVMRRNGDAARLAAVFVREWETLSSRQRDVIMNRPVVPPLADAVAVVSAARARERHFSTRRHLDRNDVVASGTHYHQACEVRYVRRGSNPPIARYVCPEDGSAKCLVCDTFFQCSIDSLRYDDDDELQNRSGDFKRKNMADLFCGPACREAYKTTTSATGLRTVVFARDAGVCAKCGTDGHRLVERLTALRGAGWGKRYRLALEFNPKWADHRAHLRKLVETPRDGLAWEADHDIRVADGGGIAQADQVQTLCVPCHRAKTKLENAKRNKRQGETEEGDLAAFPVSATKRPKVDIPGELTPPPLALSADEVLFSDEEVDPVSGEEESSVVAMPPETAATAASDNSIDEGDFSWLEDEI